MYNMLPLPISLCLYIVHCVWFSLFTVHKLVILGRDMQNPGQFVALKRIRVNCGQEEGTPMGTIREIAMLRQIDIFRHPNIVR